MKRTLSVSAVAVGALALALACGKKNEESGPAPGSQPASAPTAGNAVTPPAPGEPAHVAPPPRPQPADTTSLWALAPTDATFGFVIGDGVGLRALRALNHLYAKVADKPFAKKLVDQIAEARKQSFDFLDEAAYKGPGIDLSKGMAVFVGAGFDKPLLMVLPIVDRQAFRTLSHGKVDKIGDREVDRLDDVICLPGDRYICAESIDLIDSVLEAARQRRSPPPGEGVAGRAARRRRGLRRSGQDQRGRSRPRGDEGHRRFHGGVVLRPLRSGRRHVSRDRGRQAEPGGEHVRRRRAPG